MIKFLLLISVCMLTISPLRVEAQSMLPQADGDKVVLNTMIEMPRGHISGICILLREGSQIKGSLFNEFGISALDFIYDADKDKVKITAAMAFIDKWYIKRVLRKDLRLVLCGLEQGQCTYTNSKRNIVYQFSMLDDETERQSL